MRNSSQVRNEDITAERTFQGAWRFSTIHGNRRVSKQYFFYTKREALRLFKQELNAGTV